MGMNRELALSLGGILLGAGVALQSGEVKAQEIVKSQPQLQLDQTSRNIRMTIICRELGDSWFFVGDRPNEAVAVIVHNQHTGQIVPLVMGMAVPGNEYGRKIGLTDFEEARDRSGAFILNSPGISFHAGKWFQNFSEPPSILRLASLCLGRG